MGTNMNRGGKILAVALLGAMVTCVDHGTPGARPGRGIPTAVTEPAPGITHTLLTAGTNTVDQKVYSTTPISPAANALITVAVMAHSSRAAPSPTLSGGGMSAWTEVATITFDAGDRPHKRLTIFRAMSPTPGSGALTIKFTKSQSHCEWIVSQWEGVDISGVNGAGAIGQTGSTRADAVNGLAVTLGSFGNAANVAYGVFGVASAVGVVTPGAGFTEISEQPSAESPRSDLEAERATNDNTIDASWATALNAAALGVEIKAARTVASVEVTPVEVSIAVGQAMQLTATAKDDAGQPIPGRPFDWGTNAPLVATVSSGLVTGRGEGDAIITATTEGKSGTATVHVTAVPADDPALVGSWASPVTSPIVLVHLHLLPDGRVLSYGDGSDGPPQVWDPATGTFTAVPSPSLVFCAGHDFLPDGRLLVAGGGADPTHGLTNSNIFDYRTTSWQAGPRMSQGRWYPTSTTLPNGEVLTLVGENSSGTAGIPEVWDGATWRLLTTASLKMPYYPRAFVAPDGRVFTAGTEQQSRYLDVAGTGSWTNGPLRTFGDRPYGPAVMYEPGKILYAGGGNPPTNTAEVIDLNQPNPQWTSTGSMAYARWNSNATVLPTGEVLVTGGTSLGDRTDPAGAVKAAELWNPATGSWTTLVSNAAFRGYHSTSLLLPDGRVLHSGGGDCCGVPDSRNYELYSPPYLFKGARPVITRTTPAPETVVYGQTLTLETPDGSSIVKVSLIRSGSVTHAFDEGQRLLPLTFSQVSGGLSVTFPASGAIAPPGPYLLFLVNGNGVPSVGRIVLLQ
ncbi:MAG TPA: galactose oxidase-like domain-containing protein [Gemmatimonadales bacterium]|nr:galactose oxidase-like domain-containing protein [Gemmatimonadales bacterium]